MQVLARMSQVPWLLNIVPILPGCQGGAGQEQLPAWGEHGGSRQGGHSYVDSLPQRMPQSRAASPEHNTGAPAVHCSRGSLSHHAHLIGSPQGGQVLSVSAGYEDSSMPKAAACPAAPIMCAKLAAQSSLGSAEMVFPPL